MNLVVWSMLSMLLLEVVQAMDQAKEKAQKIKNKFFHIFHYGFHTS